MYVIDILISRYYTVPYCSITNAFNLLKGQLDNGLTSDIWNLNFFKLPYMNSLDNFNFIKDYLFVVSAATGLLPVLFNMKNFAK